MVDRSAASETTRSSLSENAATIDLDRLLPDLARDRGHALVEELRRVRALGPVLRAVGDRPPERRREARERAGVARGARSGGRAAASASPSQSSRSSSTAIVLPGGRALVPVLLRASGSRTTPRPTRACGARPRRPSRRASGRGRVSASWTIAARSVSTVRRHRGAPPPSSRSSSRSEVSRSGILVQDRREQRRLRDLERLGDVARVAGAARGDHRHRHGVGDGARDLEVVALAACRRSRSR